MREVADSHIDLHAVPSISTVGFVVDWNASPRSAKLKPKIVTTVPDWVGALLMNDCVMVGASYVKLMGWQPESLLTSTPICRSSPTPAEVMQRIAVVSIHVVFLHFVEPIVATGLRFLWPKFLPVMVRVVPLEVGAFAGLTEETTGAPYVKISMLQPTLPRTVIETL